MIFCQWCNTWTIRPGIHQQLDSHVPQWEGTSLWQTKITQQRRAAFIKSKQWCPYIPHPSSLSLIHIHIHTGTRTHTHATPSQIIQPLQSDAVQDSYQVCLTVSSALCHVAKLSYVPNFIMSSSALRNFNYVALNWCKSRSAILFPLINSPGQVKFSICNSNWPQCKRRQKSEREGGEKVLIQYLYQLC